MARLSRSRARESRLTDRSSFHIYIECAATAERTLPPKRDNDACYQRARRRRPAPWRSTNPSRRTDARHQTDPEGIARLARALIGIGQLRPPQRPPPRQRERRPRIVAARATAPTTPATPGPSTAARDIARGI